jgi:S1-C subfamily serine protease
LRPRGAAAGLRAGDVVTAIDSPTTGPRAIRSASDMTAAVYLHRIGDEIRMTVWRFGVARKFRLRLGE